MSISQTKGFTADLNRLYAEPEKCRPPKSLIPPRLDRIETGALMAYFVNSWRLNDWLLGSITNENGFYKSPDPLRHPLIFYLGHTAVFYINKLVAASLLKTRINPAYEKLYEIGVDPATTGELDSEQLWPPLKTTSAYRRRAFDVISETIDKIDPKKISGPEDPLWALLMGLEHDRIHFETSSVLIRQYDTAMLTRPEGWCYAPRGEPGPGNDMVYQRGGTAELGKNIRIPSFGWDNEYGYQEQAVADFWVSRNLITNEEFLSFVTSGGYEDPRFWSEQGWQWRCSNAVLHPRFWIGEGESFLYRAMFDHLDLPLQWPVEVNCFEARAYCRWRGKGFRLLREAEYVLMRRDRSQNCEDVLFCRDYNLNLKFGSPTPVGFLKDARSKTGINDLHGNVWTWLEDDFYPLPGFKAHPLYKDFSEPFFDNNHAMLAGGSWASTGASASQYYRLWFRRHFYQHAGFRLAKTAS